MRSVLTLLALVLALGQSATPGHASLQGQIVTSGTNAAVPHARVVAAKVGGEIADYQVVLSDPNGRFAFSDLTAGAYRIYAQRDGFLQAEYGRRAVNTTGKSISIAEGQSIPDLVLAMTPTGAIAGHVFDDGRPMARVIVRALKARMVNGERTLAAGTDWTETDDLGAYRLSGLAPGPYYVSATPPGSPRIEGDVLVTPAMPSNANNNQRQVRTDLKPDTLPIAAFDRQTFQPVYYPGTTDPSGARAVDVRPGDAAIAIDLTAARTATYRIAGRLVATDSAPASQNALTLSLVQGRAGSGRNSSLPVTRETRDSFEVREVPPGPYFLQISNQSRLCGFVPVTVVDQDVEITATCQPGVTVTGRVVMEGQTPPSGGVQLLSTISVRPPGVGGVAIQPDGTFSIPNVFPADYTFRVIPRAGNPQPWVKSAHFGGDDVLSGPIHVAGSPAGRELEIVLSPNTATLDAIVVDRDQHPVDGALVIAVPGPAFRNRPELFRTANTDATGRAHLTDVGPGEYRLFGTGQIEAADWQDPEVLRQYETLGELVRLQENDRQTVMLRVVP
jgi:hypothetical protein